MNIHTPYIEYSDDIIIAVVMMALEAQFNATRTSDAYDQLNKCTVIALGDIYKLISARAIDMGRMNDLIKKFQSDGCETIQGGGEESKKPPKGILQNKGYTYASALQDDGESG